VHRLRRNFSGLYELIDVDGVTMHSPGVALVVVGNDGVLLRPAEAVDEAFIRHLFRTTKADSFAAAQLPPAVLDTVLEQQLRAQSIGYASRFPNAASLVILLRNVPVGRLMLATSGHSWHIIDIVLLPGSRGQGIGARVIAAVERTAREQCAQELTLSVLSSNVGARRLYERLGFVETRDGVHVEMRRQLAT
jgi:ribosomal protein S18 acetylase RimI-like enzyme